MLSSLDWENMVFAGGIINVITLKNISNNNLFAESETLYIKKFINRNDCSNLAFI